MSGVISDARRIRTERLIAGGRVALAAFSVLALTLDPSAPAARAGSARGVVAAYLGYALLALSAARLAGVALVRLRVAIHAVDLAAACLLTGLTEGSDSPFFVFFVVAMVAAALRWRWPGILWTAAVALACLLGFGLYAAAVPAAPSFELDRLILRCGCLAVVAVLLGALGPHAPEQLVLARQSHEVAVSEERIRLARDLHDGVIQSLGGAALRLEAARRLLARDPAAADELLVETQDLLASEQQDLRSFIRAPALRGLEARAPEQELGARLDELRRRIEQYWGLAVNLAVDLEEAAISPSLAHEIDRIVHEALVNAARHGQASAAEVAVGLDGTGIRIAVADDGHGFSFRGDYDFAALKARKIGPVTLKQRIAAAGGSLRITSSEAGARLDIHLPLQ